MIEIARLSKQYKKGEWALQDVTLAFGRGMTGLIGPNGAGKTTLMSILATLLHPSSGKVAIEGIPITRPDEIRRLVGYLPQDFQVYPQVTAAEFLDYVAAMKGIGGRKRRREEIARLLEGVNLAGQENKKVKDFSGGMKRRLGIAQALLGSPPVLIVDEPTAGLDPEERVRFRNLLARYGRDRTVLLSTHIMADVEGSCRSAAVLRQGRVAMEGTLAELAACAAGRVWIVELSEREFAALSPTGILSAVRTRDGIRCRVLSDSKPGDCAIQAEPVLEDGYLALIGGGRNE